MLELVNGSQNGVHQITAVVVGDAGGEGENLLVAAGVGGIGHGNA